MNESIFRAYSIRGVAGESLTAEDMALIGKAAGTILAESGVSTSVVGRDYRTSSPALAAALKNGLLATGMDVTDIGPCSTPLLNYATDYYRAGAGMMVTASHNPAPYNGLKIRTDRTLRGEKLRRIYDVAMNGQLCHGRGTLTHATPLESYLESICRRVAMGRPLKVVVDAGNGAAGPFAPRLIDMLGCQAVPMYCQPDGHFPNRVPDPTAPGALNALSARVVAEQADAGVGYDGDGDRLAMVDERGAVVFGDQLLTLLAQELLAGGKHPGARVVYELSCTQALPETVEALGGQAIPCPVGYAFVHETMLVTGAVLGGEAAGHLFFAEPDFRFDDALLATAKMLSLLSKTPLPFSALLAALPRYHLSPERRFQCPDDVKADIVAHICDRFVAQGYEIERMDGAKVHFGDGWGLFRSSNTQPAVTLRCEAKTPARLAEIEQIMLDAARAAMDGAGIAMTSAH